MDANPVPGDCTMLFQTEDDYQKHQKEIHVRLLPDPIRTTCKQTSPSERLAAADEKQRTSDIGRPPISAAVPLTGPDMGKEDKAIACDSTAVVDMELEDEGEQSGVAGLLIRPASASLCSKCGQTFPTHRDFEVHMNEYHNIELESPAVQQIIPLAVDEYITCPLCHGRVLQKELQHHISLHAPPATLSHSCPNCDRCFSHLSDLEDHKRQKHETAHRRSKSPVRSHTRQRSGSPRHSDRSERRRRSRSPRRRERSDSRRRSRSRSPRQRHRSQRSPTRRSRDRSPARSRSDRTHSHRTRERSLSRERSPPDRHRRRSRSPDHMTPVYQICPLCSSSFNTLTKLLAHLEHHHFDAVHAARLPVVQMQENLRKLSFGRRDYAQREIESEIRRRLSQFGSNDRKRGHSPDADSSRSRRRDEEKTQPRPDPRRRPPVPAPRTPPDPFDQTLLLSDRTESTVPGSASDHPHGHGEERDSDVTAGDERFLKIGALLGLPMGQLIDLTDYLSDEEEKVDVKPAKKGHSYSNQSSALPQVPGRCEACNERMFDLITHCSGFHNSKISFDIAVQDFLSTERFF